MKKRIYLFWRTIVALWHTFSRPAKMLIILFALIVLLMIAFSSDPGFYALICLGLLGLSLLSGLVVYRLITRVIK